MAPRVVRIHRTVRRKFGSVGCGLLEEEPTRRSPDRLIQGYLLGCPGKSGSGEATGRLKVICRAFRPSSRHSIRSTNCLSSAPVSKSAGDFSSIWSSFQTWHFDASRMILTPGGMKSGAQPYANLKIAPWQRSIQPLPRQDRPVCSEGVRCAPAMGRGQVPNAHPAGGIGVADLSCSRNAEVAEALARGFRQGRMTGLPCGIGQKYIACIFGIGNKPTHECFTVEPRSD